MYEGTNLRQMEVYQAHNDKKKDMGFTLIIKKVSDVIK